MGEYTLMFCQGRGEPCPQGKPEGLRSVVFKLWLLRDNSGHPGPVSRGDRWLGKQLCGISPKGSVFTLFEKKFFLSFESKKTDSVADLGWGRRYIWFGQFFCPQK